MENPNIKWMRTGGTPISGNRKPPYNFPKLCDCSDSILIYSDRRWTQWIACYQGYLQPSRFVRSVFFRTWCFGIASNWTIQIKLSITYEPQKTGVRPTMVMSRLLIGMYIQMGTLWEFSISMHVPSSIVWWIYLQTLHFPAMLPGARNQEFTWIYPSIRQSNMAGTMLGHPQMEVLRRKIGPNYYRRVNLMNIPENLHLSR